MNDTFWDELVERIADRVAARQRPEGNLFECVTIPKAAKLVGVGENRMRKWIAEGAVNVIQRKGEQPLIRLATLEQNMRELEGEEVNNSANLQARGRRLAR